MKRSSETRASSSPRGFFVTGTDTGVGKTLVAAWLAVGLRLRGHSVGVMKPVATGGISCKDDWGRPALVAQDTRILHRAAGGRQPLSTITPYVFELPASPHLAARHAGSQVQKERIVEAVHELAAQFEILILEGMGGLLVPLRDDWLVADLAASIDLPLLVVARSGLGTLNHTLLTLDVARARGLAIAGVIFNQTDWPDRSSPDDPWTDVERDNIETIHRLGSVPILGAIPHLPSLRDKDPVDVYGKAEPHILWDRVLAFLS